MPKDYQGRDIPPGETPETRVKVWSIEPTPSSGDMTDYVIRDYHEAGTFAADLLGNLMDNAEPGCPISLKVTITEMSLADYQEIQNSDE